jgi:dihydrofolate reductase
MAPLIFSAITSLDGYVADADGNFDWAEPDAAVHAFVNEQMRAVGTHLYGRRLYEVMQYWETGDTVEGTPPVEQDFARIWQAADKVVYSRTLESVPTARTRIEREFDPEAVRQLKETAGRDLTVGGPELAAQAIEAGLVDEYHLFLVPVVVGGGKHSLPDRNVLVKLELLDERRFRNGTMYLHYRTRRAPP